MSVPEKSPCILIEAYWYLAHVAPHALLHGPRNHYYSFSPTVQQETVGIFRKRTQKDVQGDASKAY